MILSCQRSETLIKSHRKVQWLNLTRGNSKDMNNRSKMDYLNWIFVEAPKMNLKMTIRGRLSIAQTI